MPPASQPEQQPAAHQRTVRPETYDTQSTVPPHVARCPSWDPLGTSVCPSRLGPAPLPCPHVLRASAVPSVLYSAPNCELGLAHAWHPPFRTRRPSIPSTPSPRAGTTSVSVLPGRLQRDSHVPQHPHKIPLCDRTPSSGLCCTPSPRTRFSAMPPLPLRFERGLLLAVRYPQGLVGGGLEPTAPVLARPYLLLHNLRVLQRKHVRTRCEILIFPNLGQSLGIARPGLLPHNLRGSHSKHVHVHTQIVQRKCKLCVKVFVGWAGAWAGGGQRCG